MAELNLKQIEEKLNMEFAGVGRRLVFWYDDKADFVEEVDKLQLENAKLLKLTPVNQFRTKVLLEREDTDNNYLIYASFAKPEITSNHLEDTLLYSKRFYADRISLICADLKIRDELKPVLQKYSKFFAKKERTQGFYDFNLDCYTEELIETAIICSICKTHTVSLEEALCKILVDSRLDENQYLDELNKLGMLEVFWRLCSNNFGFSAIEPNVEKLVISMFVTYADKYLGGDIPDGWKKHLATKQGNVIAFMDGLMNNVIYGQRFDELSRIVCENLKVKDVLSSYSIEKLVNLEVFECVDKFIIQWLVERLLLEDIGATINGKDIMEVCELRKHTHFSYQYENYYGMVGNAYAIIKCAQYVPVQGIKEIIDKYIKEDYKIDYWYRQYYSYLDRLDNFSSFSKLTILVENIYANVYLGKLIPAWNLSMKNINDTLSLKKQVNFYRDNISSDRDRVLVIISDALRYEVAAELVERLKEDRRCREIKLSNQVSVLPSYTALGMAALLPHKKITMTDDYKVMVNDKKCASLQEREKIIQETCKDSVCVQFDDLKVMKRDELRNLLAFKQVVYIYHNQIDARGDAAKTEDEVFVACQEAINEIANMVLRLPATANIVKFIVTADHGFIYQRHIINEGDKIPVSVSSDAYVNHRFVMDTEPVDIVGVNGTKLGVLLNTDDNRVVSYPVGNQIFKAPGSGMNYVHGGSSPQEMIVPVVTIKMEKGHVDTHPADIQLMSIVRKITSLNYNLDFVQTEPISDTVKAASYKLFFVDEDGQLISNERILDANSRSAETAKRMTTVKFTFKSQVYNSHRNYYLIIKDIANDVEVYRKDVIIDMPFVDDFGW